MKVLLVGCHNPNFVNTIVYRQKALTYLGHEVISFNESGYCLPGRIRDRFEALQQWDLKRLNQSLISLIKSRKPDVCIVAGGHTLLPETVCHISQSNIPIALWTTDVPVHFQRILDGARYYTHLFCAGTEAMEIFQDKGFHNTTWIPFACDPNFHQRLEVDEKERQEYGRDIIFVGSYYPNRAIILESIADFDLGVWGPYWNKLSASSPLKSKTVDIKMNYDRWVKIFNACKINIVSHYQDGQTLCYQASPKIFEAMACGSFVLTDQQKDVQTLFKDREHLVYFNGKDDLRSKIRYFLDHSEERKKIALSGYNHVIKNHTYQHRLKAILDVLTNRL